MPNNPIPAGQGAWRFITGASLPASFATAGLASGFCLEAWVRPASMARTVRAFSAKDYGGDPVELVEGRYEDLGRFRFSGSLWGLELPEDMRVVLFSQPGCVGESLLVEVDSWSLPEAMRSARSALVLDGSHRRQDQVVVFNQGGLRGQAAALRVALAQTVDFAVVSALVPVGVELRVLGTAYTPPDGRADNMNVPRGSTFLATRSANAAPSESVPGASSSRAVGVLTATGGLGLQLELVTGQNRSRGRVACFSGQQLRERVWHHVAVSWTGSELVSVLDGKEVGRSAVTPSAIRAALAQNWRLGADLRGSIARVRVWAQARDAATIRAHRFEDTRTEALDGFAFDETDADGAADGVLWCAADLPPDPARTALYQQAKASAESKHHADMSVANAAADVLKQGAAARAAAELADARRQAQVRVHLSAIAQVAFARGSQLVHAEGDSTRLDGRAVRFTDGSATLVTDTALPGDATSGEIYLAVASPTPKIAAWNPKTNALRVVRELTSAPCALAVVPGIRDGGVIRTCVYWIDESNWLRGGWEGTTETSPLNAVRPGRPRSWDLTGSPSHIIWSNGWEIWRVIRGQQVPEILVPHALSPHPVAVNLSSDGVLVWVDLEDEVVRSLDLAANPPQRVPVDLYPAPRPGRGVATGLVPGQGEVPVLYWIAADRQRLEVPVLDSPGLFLWLDDRENSRAPFQQHVPALRDVRLVGGLEWGRPSGLRSPGLGDRLGNGAYLSFDRSPISLPATSWTLEACFVWPLPPGRTYHTLFRGPSVGHHVLIYQLDGEFKLGSWGGTFKDSRFAFPDSTAHGSHHLAATCDGTQTTFYLDGLQVGSAPVAVTEAIKFVGDFDGAQGFGPVRAVRVWGRVCTPAEIKQSALWKEPSDKTSLLLDLPLDDAGDAPAARSGTAPGVVNQLAAGPLPTPTVLQLGEPGRRVELGPVLLDLSRGLSASVNLRWDSPDPGLPAHLRTATLGGGIGPDHCISVGGSFPDIGSRGWTVEAQIVWPLPDEDVNVLFACTYVCPLVVSKQGTGRVLGRLDTPLHGGETVLASGYTFPPDFKLGVHHLAARGTESGVDYFVDGRQVGHIAGTLADSLQYVGNQVVGKGCGPMWKVRVWERACTDAELWAFAREESPVDTNALVLDLPLDGPSLVARRGPTPGWYGGAPIPALPQGALLGMVRPLQSSLVVCLASTERRDQLALVIEPDGTPALHLRRDGRRLDTTAPRQVVNAQARIPIGQTCAVTWSVSPTGLLSVQVDGAPAYTQKLPWRGDAVLYTACTAGGPPPPRADVVRSGAMLHQDDPPEPLEAFRGWIQRLLVWNTAVEAEELHRMATDGSAEPRIGPDTWDRSLVVDETAHRFLHVGRLDGAESPLALFPIELDGGLALVTQLSAGHAVLARAHAEKAAAEAHAAALKAAKLEAARASEEGAKRDHASAAAQAVAALSDANAKASRKRAAAEAERVRQAALAAKQIADAKGDADVRMQTARAQQQTTVAAATAEADRRKSGAQRELEGAKTRRAEKQQELDAKRAGG